MKTVLVTGTTGAVGLGVAKHLLERGFRVLGCGRKEGGLAHQNYHHHRFNLACEQEVNEFFGQARTTFPELYGLVQCAAVASMNHLITTPVESIEGMLRVNVEALFLICRESAKWMQGRGRIVHLSSAALVRNLEGEGGYLASKAAVETLSRVYAKELAPLGITVNCIAPSVFEGGLVSGVPAAKLKALLALQAFPRECTAADIANALDFFLDEKSDMITGQVLSLGGLV